MNTLMLDPALRLVESPIEYAPRLSAAHLEEDDTPRWPVYEDGRPKPFAGLTPPEQQSWFARGLRAALIAYEVADAMRCARGERW